MMVPAIFGIADNPAAWLIKASMLKRFQRKHRRFTVKSKKLMLSSKADRMINIPAVKTQEMKKEDQCQDGVPVIDPVYRRRKNQEQGEYHRNESGH